MEACADSYEFPEVCDEGLRNAIIAVGGLSREKAIEFLGRAARFDDAILEMRIAFIDLQVNNATS
jgi:hypothetical protein